MRGVTNKLLVPNGLVQLKETVGSTVLDGWRNRQIQMMYSMDPDVQDLQEVNVQYIKSWNK
jgi:hypothetical protein